MKFIVFYVLYAFCVFYVIGDELTEFKKSLEQASQRIVDYEQEFSNGILVLVSDLKDITAKTLGGSWNGTMLFPVLTFEKADTDEKKHCIVFVINELEELVSSIPFTLDTCRKNFASTGQSIRKNLQSLHQRMLNLINEVDAIRPSCSQESDKSEQCIFSKLLDLRVIYNDIAKDFSYETIEKGNIMPIILSEAMQCNAKILKDFYEGELNIKQKIQQCIYPSANWQHREYGNDAIDSRYTEKTIF